MQITSNNNILAGLATPQTDAGTKPKGLAQLARHEMQSDQFTEQINSTMNNIEYVRLHHIYK